MWCIEGDLEDFLMEIQDLALYMFAPHVFIICNNKNTWHGQLSTLLDTQEALVKFS